MAKIKSVKTNPEYDSILGTNASDEYKMLLDNIELVKDGIAEYREAIMQDEAILETLEIQKRNIENLFIVEYEEEERKSINNECNTVIANRSDARYA